MTSPKPESQAPQIRAIRRKQIQQYLAISAFIATQLVTGCDMAEEDEPAEVDPMLPALFYETTEQCEATQQKDAVQLTADPAQQPPSPNPAPDCAQQITAARAEHDRHAPVYQSLTNCQADGIQCEPTPYGYDTFGYRPSYGGAYFYSGSYMPHTVYRGLNGGEIVTPQGQVLVQPGFGSVSVPQSISVAAPPRPPGYAAVGTIKGRNNGGFGSTYKNTGSGGK
jgi:hypothetical protein